MEAGTALAVVSLTFQTFAGCVQGFVLLSDAHNLGKDASLLRTMLNLEEYHFIQWAKKVGLLEPEAKLDPRLNQALAVELMGQLKIFLGTNKLRERYKLELVVDRPATCNVVDTNADNDAGAAQGILAQAVSNETRGEILARANLIQSKNLLPKRLWWAAVDKSKFEKLVRDVRTVVQGFWALLDPLQQDEVMQRIQQVLSVVIEVSQDVKGLRDLKEALMESKERAGKDTVPLATAAGFKAIRLQIDDSNGSKSVPDALKPAEKQYQRPSTDDVPSHRQIILPPLTRHLLTDYIAKPSNPCIGTALYTGKPVLVEHKSVGPKMKAKLKSRAENLAVLLSTPKDDSFLTLHCLGFFEDGDCFVFVYAYPTGSPSSTGISHPTSKPQPVSLLDLLCDPTIRPSVTARLNLALNISHTLLTFHTAGWLHKDIRSENILFFPSSSPSENTSTAKLMERPYLTGFAFARFDSPSEMSEQPSPDPQSDIYRHYQALGVGSKPYSKYMDLYSLGLIMLEISEWRPLKDLVSKHVDVTKQRVNVPLSKIQELGPWLVGKKVDSGRVEFRMGEVFGRAVARSLRACKAEGIPRPEEEREILHENVRSLERCVV